MNADARRLIATPQRNRYALTLRIEEGPRYPLGNVRFQTADPDKKSLAFSETELRQLFHMHMRRGDLLNVTKIRAAMLELTQLYDAIGYIDMVPEPGFDIDDTGCITDLIIKIDEGPQYRVGEIDFLGLDEKTQSLLRPQLHPGDLYNPNLVDELLKRNKSLLPPDVSRDDVSVTRTPKDHLVNLRFEFHSCPDKTISAVEPTPP